MKIKKEKSFGDKVVATAAKVAVAAVLFPYQVTVDRKDGHYSVRSLALRIKVDRVVKEDGSKHREFSFDIPGCSTEELKKKVTKIVKKYQKKKMILKKEAEEGPEEVFDGEFDEDARDDVEVEFEELSSEEAEMPEE